MKSLEVTIAFMLPKIPKNIYLSKFSYSKINIIFQRHRWPPNIWVHLLLLGVTLLVPGVSGQCFGGVETYEKTSGTTVLCDNGCTSQGLLSQPDTSVTRDCIAICKQTSSCTSFTVGKNQK